MRGCGFCGASLDGRRSHLRAKLVVTGREATVLADRESDLHLSVHIAKCKY